MRSIETCPPNAEVICDSCEPCETAPAVSAEPTTVSRPIYEVPSVEETQQETAKAAEQEAPIIQEIIPAPSSNTLDLNNEPSLSGGAFKPLNSDGKSEPVTPKVAPLEKADEVVSTEKVAPLEKTEKVVAAEDPETATTKETDKKLADDSAENPLKETIKEVIEEPKALDTPAPATPTPTPAPTPAPTTPDPAPTPATPTPTPATPAPAEVKPKSTFKPGQPFKPKKAKSTESSWNDLDANFYQHGADETYSGTNELLAESSDLEMPTEQDPVNSFFGRKDQTEAKPLPKAQSTASTEKATDKRIVLQANPVERSVVYMPPPKNVSTVAVPALRASFKSADSATNWLRNENHVVKTLPPVEPEDVDYPQTSAPKLAVKQVTKPAPVIEMPVEETLKTDQPRVLAVRLKAIPMYQSNRRQLSEARFREHQPVQRVAQTPQPEKVIEATEPLKQVEVKEPNLDIRVATPPKAEPAPHTARALEDEFATPPWRIE